MATHIGKENPRYVQHGCLL